MIETPLSIIEQISLKPDAHVADIGAGAGHYTLPLARMLQTGKGKVFAIDVREDHLQKIESDAGKEELDNISIVLSNAEEIHGTRLRDSSIDVVFLANMLFQVERKDKPVLFEEVYRILKVGGVVVIVDWTDSFGGLGPQPDHIVLPEDVRALAERQKFTFEKNIETGDHHYGMVFRK